MRINLLTTTALMLCSGAAMADEHNLRPYIGAEVNYTNVDFRSSGGISYDEVFASGYKGVTPYVGLQLNKHVAIEAGYLQTSSENKDISPLISGLGFTGSTKTKLKGFHADVIGRLPVSKDEKIALLGSAGVGRYKAETKVTVASGSFSDSAKIDGSDTAMRLGLGAEYAFTDNVSMRGMVRYVPISFNDRADHAIQAGVGVSYKF